jgi:hypothetical protein
MIKKHKLLAALRPEAIVAVKRALGEYAELLPVHSFDEAVKRLREEPEVDAVLCGIYFAQTRMFDLLSVVRADFPDIPFVCCRIGDSDVPGVTLEAIGIAARSMGAKAFINLPVMRAADFDAEFRSRVLANLKPHQP